MNIKELYNLIALTDIGHPGPMVDDTETAGGDSYNAHKYYNTSTFGTSTNDNCID